LIATRVGGDRRMMMLIIRPTTNRLAAVVQCVRTTANYIRQAYM